MTNEEMKEAWRHFRRVKVVNSDYVFSGLIVSVFNKRFHPVKGENCQHTNRQTRCVVESDDRVCLIQSAKNLVLAEEEVTKLEKMEEIRQRPITNPELYRNGNGNRRIRK